jgi:hypothetical protein
VQSNTEPACLLIADSTGALEALEPAIDAEMASRRAAAARDPAEPPLAESAARNLTQPIVGDALNVSIQSSLIRRLDERPRPRPAVPRRNPCATCC